MSSGLCSPSNLSMTARKLTALILILSVLAPTAFAADLININTADLATLETLNGIGASKGQAIIDYRTQHGVFATIADIQNVSGIGPTTYANIKDYITVGDASTQAVDPSTTSASTSSTASTSTQTQVVIQSGGSLPPPISASITTDATAVVGAGTLFVGASFNQAGDPLLNPRYLWNFGDGATAEGVQMWHTYSYTGTYNVVLSVGSGISSASARAVVDAAPARVSLVAEGDGSLTIANQSDYDLDIGLWSLKEGTSTFVIPEGTTLLRGKGVRFSPTVLKFSGDESVNLYYQNGTFAAAASTGANSPLRGEVVDMAAVSTLKTSSISAAAASPGNVASSYHAVPTSTLNGANQAAAAAKADLGGEWMYLAGLAAVVAIGALGTYYAYPTMVERPAETIDESDEFEIVE
jgi:competence ComEA-like helix-hairpin-helix protein